MFVDVVSVDAKAGDGGDGKLSFRHEKYVEKGGPDGGDGGNGGNVVFRATSNKNTLVEFRYKKRISANDGHSGDKRNKRGKSAENLIIDVPVGTTIIDDTSGKILADLTENNQEQIVLFGGQGGFGNAHFKSSTRQAPRLAEKGEKGDAKKLKLEMKMVADVGLVGMPNAGKSTFLSVVSEARPKIANYPFTTKSPNLGVATIDDKSLLIADIPGLIEGASQGKGLGDEFLRHVSRCKVLLHFIDSTDDDIAKTYKAIQKEIINYGGGLDLKPQIIVLTKADLIDDDIANMQQDILKEVLPKNTAVHVLSSKTHTGTKQILHSAFKVVDTLNTNNKDNNDLPVITLAQDTMRWEAMRTGKHEFTVTGGKLEKFARRTNFEQNDGVSRLRDIMRKKGVLHELVKQGIEPGDTIVIGQPQEGKITY